MRNEQEYYDNERRGRPHRHEQNAADRWGKPDPRMSSHEDDYPRQEEHGRMEEDIRQNWRPFDLPRNRHFQDDRHRHTQHPHHRNQQADNRWGEGLEMHPHHHPRHASERFYEEQRRRNY
ncbi:hypothetical protein H7F15_02620 [Pontibacter sp. Tf4]|uniref:hypothetical protein n=1 Tax=Pontibacter sp. Tf4 TaxID=2761620 RepID=UPI001626EC15|nr:hypothetical protein [Pontibacter sp. Tf4]MBB6609920.1 hypothetical protein [Pontibacter sp. Tf4]